jgi:hypothetical protein
MNPNMCGRLPRRMSAVSAAARRKSALSFLYSRSCASSTEDSPPSCTTPYPASSTAFSRSRGSISPAMYPTVAFSLARFTLASRTPGTFLRARSTRRTQEAQVILVTGMLIRANRSLLLVVSTPDSRFAL